MPGCASSKAFFDVPEDVGEGSGRRHQQFDAVGIRGAGSRAGGDEQDGQGSGDEPSGHWAGAFRVGAGRAGFAGSGQGNVTGMVRTVARHDHDAGGDPTLLAAKASLREMVWGPFLERRGRPVSGCSKPDP